MAVVVRSIPKRAKTRNEGEEEEEGGVGRVRRCPAALSPRGGSVAVVVVVTGRLHSPFAGGLPLAAAPPGTHTRTCATRAAAVARLRPIPRLAVRAQWASRGNVTLARWTLCACLRVREPTGRGSVRGRRAPRRELAYGLSAACRTSACREGRGSRAWLCPPPVPLWSLAE